ncbi:MAG: SsrA-binding protein SmpB [Firmicutes bacterium]|nr:SsrA-binding protein SmpB [Bacillota bacterium]
MKQVASNKKAYHNYFILDTIEAGIQLYGWEVKSARANKVSLLESFVYISLGKNNTFEVHLKNSHFANYENGVVKEQDVRRSRKLLMNRNQIDKFHKAVATKGVTCVVTRIYFNKKGLLKAEVALAKGKQTFDKKQVLKERDLKRETERAIKIYK